MDNYTLPHAALSTGSLGVGVAETCAPDAASVSGAAGAEASSLGIIARCSSTASQRGIWERDFSRVITRFALQSAARSLLPRERVSLCLRRPIPQRSVDVLYSPAGQAAHYGGLQVCASVWHCPVCAAKISERRRVELSLGLRSWASPVLLVTFTLQHTTQDDLSLVLASLKAARARLVSGRAAKSFAAQYGLVGMIRSLEVTYGLNGWHPHLHVLYFFDRDVPFLPFEQDIKECWTAAVASVGRSASLQHGCDVRFSDKAVADYVAKWGKEPQWTVSHEITKAVVKRGRDGGCTPLELLANYLTGDASAGRRWLEYAVNFKGERQLHWSHGLRARLGLVEDEKTDDELAVEQEEVAVILASLSLSDWHRVLANDARGELLEVASSGDSEAVKGFLRALGK